MKRKNPLNLPSPCSGSLTVEAALSLTLFFFFVILLSVPMDLLNTQRKIQMVLESKARDLSSAAWMIRQEEAVPQAEAVSQEEAVPQAEAVPQGESGESKGADAILSQAAIALYLKNAVQNAAGKGRIEAIDCSGTRISADGEIIDLRATYRLKLPFSVFALDSIPFSARSRKQGWVGKEGGACFAHKTQKEQETMVFVGRDSTRYHLSPDCHYLSNRVTAVLFESLKEQKNASGSYYMPCRVCGAEAGEGTTVYIFTNGEVYHSRSDCSSVSFYLHRVPLSEAEYLGACSYCGGGIKD